jgi:hypothetical protein
MSSDFCEDRVPADERQQTITACGMFDVRIAYLEWIGPRITPGGTALSISRQ